MTGERGSAGAAGPGTTSARAARRARPRAPALDEGTRRALAFVPRRTRAIRAPLVRFRLGAADRSLVEPGDPVAVGAPLLERAREVVAAEARIEPDHVAPDPGAKYEAPASERTRAVRPLSGTVLYTARGGRLRVAATRHRDTFLSPVAGTVESVDGGSIVLRVEGFGIPAAVAWGQPVVAPLRLAVSDPDAELRAGAIDVGAAGTVLVAGSHADSEAVTRARAIGVRGIVTGGLVGQELRQLEASDRRQRAGLHAASPFGLIVLDAYGRRPIPGPWWDALRAAEGRHVALLMDPPMLTVDELPRGPRLPTGVRISTGADAGREGALLGLAGPVRGSAGQYQPAAYVALLPPAAPRRADGAEDGDAAPAAPVVRIVPTADLERFE